MNERAKRSPRLLRLRELINHRLDCGHRRFATSKVMVYRYDNEDYAEGEVIRPQRGSFPLTENQEDVERVIRSTLPNGEDIRGNSIYTWASEPVAKRVWPHSGRKYLYQLEVDEAHIRFRGDLNWYSAAVDKVAAGKAPDDAVNEYCSGQRAGAPFTEPRIEVLVSEARVIRKL